MGGRKSSTPGSPAETLTVLVGLKLSYLVILSYIAPNVKACFELFTINEEHSVYDLKNGFY